MSQEIHGGHAAYRQPLLQEGQQPSAAPPGRGRQGQGNSQQGLAESHGGPRSHLQNQQTPPGGYGTYSDLGGASGGIEPGAPWPFGQAPHYQETRDATWVKCESSLRRHQDFSHFLDMVTPDHQRTWPTYDARRPGHRYEPTVMEESKISEELWSEVRNVWRHTAPGSILWWVPAVHELEVTDETITTKTLKPEGRSSARVMHITDVTDCSLEYKAPASYSLQGFLVVLINSYIGRMCRSQPLYLATLAVTLLSLVCEVGKAPVSATFFLVVSTVGALMLLMLGMCREAGLVRGLSLLKDQVPYPSTTSYQRHSGMTDFVQTAPYGCAVAPDGTYALPPDKEDISMELYEKERSKGGGICLTGFIFFFGVTSSVICIACNYKAIKAQFSFGPGSGKEASGDNLEDVSWDRSNGGSYGCNSCLGLIVGYTCAFTLAACLGFRPLPLFRYKDIPRSSCQVNLMKGDKKMAKVDLGDIENAKAASQYILEKRQRKLREKSEVAGVDNST
eukprot:gb/GECG01002446.1/.p1 GENE.gb/GECG01002446.1/~~gb/GECG01002446.1/.p1  ORF type:complete len:506 (+),score=44.77 gb/GECG01002446.1/:1-1518(+)